MMKNLILFASILFIGSNLFAQEGTVTGKIKGQDGLSIPGASVVEKGTTNGVATDIDGNYTIKVSNIKTAILQFSYLGYATQNIAVAGREKIDITLAEATTDIDEVVVVGYGTTTKKEITGATSKVEGEAIEKLNIPRMDQALQGQVSGVSINTNSGSPGGSASIQIRGLSTFGNNDPLILVDDVVYSTAGLNALNPNDIKSINIIKDATAGIYGVRAANGVIIIETKKGSMNSKLSVDFSGFIGLQQTANRLNLLNATEYAVVKNEIFGSTGEDLPFNNTLIGAGTDWQDEVFQNAWMKNYNLSISGGSKNSTYNVGFSYLTQDGIVGGDKSNFTRYNARLNFTNKLNERLKLYSVLLYSNDKRSTLPENGLSSVLYNTINAPPNQPVRTSSGNYSYLEEVADIINPIAQIENTFNGGIANKIVGKEELVYEINNHFTFSNRLSYTYSVTDDKSFSPLVWYGNKNQSTAINADLEPRLVPIGDTSFVERGAGVFEQKQTFVDITAETFLNYKRTFQENHSVKGTLGAAILNKTGNALGGTANHLPGNSIEFADIAASRPPLNNLNTVFSWQFEERLLSTFIRGEYGYKGKYMFSAILRRDGSSKFGPNNKFGMFPTASAAWVISEEKFFTFKKITFAKVRASYGISGNDQIANFAYRAQLNGEGEYVFDNNLNVGVAIGRASNPDLKWETTRQFNLGLDLTIGDPFTVTVNYFIKNTNDLLFTPNVSAVLGTGGALGQSPIVNAGNISNRGLELELGYSTDPKKKLVFNTNFNFTYLKNEVTSTPDGVDFINGANFGIGVNPATRFETGFPIGYFIGLETDGIWNSSEEIANSPIKQVGARPGDLKYKDLNGDGEIDFTGDTDKKMLGSPIPDYIFGLNFNVRFSNFDFSTNLYAAIGQELIRNYERQQPFANQLDYVIDRWVGSGTSDEIPQLSLDNAKNNAFSNYFVEDGDFLRIRNVQLGYTLPKKWSEKIKSQSFRIYVSVNNLYTLTRYRGFDPEIGSFGQVLAAGVDNGFYPQARTVMGGFNLKF